MSNKTKKVYISGMTCVSCETIIKDELLEIDGIESVRISHKKKSAEIVYKSEKLPLDEIISKVRKVGYEASLEPINKEVKKKANMEQWFYAILVVFGIYLVYKYLQWIGLLDWINEDTSEINYGASFIIGIVASLSSCLVVVGAVVMSFASKHQSHGNFYNRNLKPHLLFHIGRLGAFFLLGGLLGTIGSVISLSNTFMSWFTVIIALVLVWLALNILGLVPSITTFGLHMPKNNMNFWQKLKNSEHALAPAILGAFSFFLPCGFTQSMQLFAISSGNFWTGAWTLFLFALGTVPVLLGLGVTTTKFKNMNTVVLQKAIGIIVLLFAFYTMSAGLAISGVSVDLGQNDAEPTVVVMDGEVQVINMVVDYNGYSPSTFNLKKGVAVRWVIDGQQISGCTNEIMVPEMNIRQKLKQGENIIEFTPTKSGNISFSCWMGMVRGKFIVE